MYETQRRSWKLKVIVSHTHTVSNLSATQQTSISTGCWIWISLPLNFFATVFTTFMKEDVSNNLRQICYSSQRFKPLPLTWVTSVQSASAIDQSEKSQNETAIPQPKRTHKGNHVIVHEMSRWVPPYGLTMKTSVQLTELRLVGSMRS